MNVLLINNSDRTGGAAVACNRLAAALSDNGVRVKLLVNRKITDNSYVVDVRDSRYKRLKRNVDFYLERLRIFLNNGYSRKTLFAVSDGSTGTSIVNTREFRVADVIHIHWTSQGFLSLESLREIIESGKKIVWTMHDMWSMTGICHYSGDCEGYKTGCGKCFLLHSENPEDLSFQTFKRKHEIIANKNITFVGCSRWIADKAMESPLAAGNRVVAIPNPIDTGFFSPGPKKEARERLGLPTDKKLLLFGAAIATDERKGLRYLFEALNRIEGLGDDTELVMFGEIKGDIALPADIRIHNLGYVSDAEKLLDMYRACDVFVTPSLEDNLPNMVMEALSCGTLCVGFETGGIPEMITHRRSGYVARYKDTGDLAAGIEFALTLSDDPVASQFAREFVLNNYSPKDIACKLLEIYNN